MNYKRIPLGPLWTNSYVLDDGKGVAFCVDPGWEPSEILSYLRSENLRLAAIVLTHCHFDHILGVPELKRATGVPVYVPELDEPMLSSPSSAMAYGFKTEPVKAEHILHDGESFSIGEISLFCIHTPGHTQGSMSIIASQGDEKILIAGDTLFARSIGRTDLEGGDPHAMKKSLERLKEISGDMPVLPGHGPETSLQREREWNPFLNGAEIY